MPILIILSAFIIRFVGIWWGYPVLLHGDEQGEIVSGAFDILDFGASNGVPPITHNGPLLKYLMAFIFGIWGIIGSLFVSMQGMIDIWKASTIDHIIARIVIGLLAGTFTVYMLYRIGSRFGGRICGLAAAFLLAVTFKHVEFSHLATSDISAVLLVVLVLHFALKYIDSGRLSELRWSGIFWGAAAAVKLSTMPALIIPFTAWVLAKPPSVKGKWQGIINLVLFSFGAAALFHLPYLANPLSFIKEIVFTLLVQTFYYDKGFFWYFRPDIFPASELPTAGMGFTLLLVCLAGLTASLIAPGKKKWVVLAFPIIFYLIIGNAQVKLTRYFLPMIPFLCLWGGYLFQAVYGVLKDRLPKRLLTAGILAIILVLTAPNIYNSFLFNYNCTLENSAVIFTRNLDNYIEPDTKWGIANYFPTAGRLPGQPRQFSFSETSKQRHDREKIGQIKEKMPFINKLMKDVKIREARYSFEESAPETLRVKYGIEYFVISSVSLNKFYYIPAKHFRYPDEIAIVNKNIDILMNEWELVYKEEPLHELKWGECHGGKQVTMYLYRCPE
ncbi:glycosyltransferase family 39 protein [bacterium]|nr:glycosyltransferase family 39 protein [bacterium]